MFRGMLLRRSLLKVAVMTLVLLLASLVTLLTRSSDPAAAATQGPIASWSFDQEATSLEDLSEHENTATVEGATWTPHGRYGGAYEFDGEESCVTVADGPQFQLGEELTLEAWVRPASAGEFSPVFYKQAGETGYGYVLWAGEGEDGVPAGEVNDGTYPEPQIEAKAELPPNVWSRLALTFDGAHMRLYVDGELVATGASGAPIASEGPLEIGCGNDFGYEHHFDGRIDEPQVYERALSAGEVVADMETPLETAKQGPVAEYSFDEKNEETATDLSEEGHTATLEHTKWTSAGRYGGALEFDGGESCVKVPDSPQLQGGEEFTVEAWVRPTATREFAPVFFKQDAELNYGYALWAAESESGHPAGEITDGTWPVPGLEAKAELPPNVWSHLALTFDGAHMRLYVDGELVSTAASGAPIPSAGSLEIGCADDFGFEDHFEGRIDEARIYERALGAAEVDADMETPIQTPKVGPVAAYSFDEGEIGTEGGTVEDVSEHEHTATLEGGATRVKGRYGDALHFREEGDCATVPDSPELRLSEEFTLEAWVWAEGGLYEDPVVVREAGGKGVFGIGIGSREEGEAEGFIGEGKGSKAAIGGGEEVREKTWVHIATTYDGAKLRLYVDGELVATKSATTPPLTGEGALRIGCDGPDGPFGGRIDEVRLYGRALNGPEVDSDMESPLQTPKQTPVASYSFDEKNEETAADTSGDGHTATVEGAKWTEHGRYGGAMEFKASEDDVLKIPASEELDFDEEFTLEAWVRPSGEDNHHAPLIDKQEGSGHGYFLYEGGTVSDRPYGAANEEQEFVHAEEPLPADTWSHVALVFSGNRTYLYVNGELVDNGAAEPTVTEEGELEIGGSTDTADYFDGRIDEVRIYNRELDSVEVDADMEAPIQTPKQGPVAAWSFEEGTGTTVEDVTGDGHTATIEGAEWARGRYGGAVKFNGTSSCVSIADASDLRFGEEFTLESWVRPEGELKHDPVIFKEGSGHLNYALEVGRAATGKAEGAIGTSASPNHKEVTSVEALEANVWSHLAETFDGATLRLYVNGELVDTETVAGAGSGREGALKIGCDSQYGEHFKGRIDEVKLYNRALSGDEVQDSAPPRFDGGLKLFVNNTSGAEAPDVYFWEAEDPLNPDGSPGSGVAGYEYRYAVNGSAYTGWLVDSAPHFVATTASAGDELSVQVRAYDLADNRSEIYEATQIVPEAVEATEEAEEPEEGIINLSTYVLPESQSSVRPETTEEPGPLNENNVPPSVRKRFHEILPEDGCASVGTEPEVRLLNGRPFEVSDTYVKCRPETWLATATFKVDLRKVVPGKAIAPIEEEEFFSVRGPASEVHGPYRTKIKCASGEVREWLAETHATWYHINPLRKKAWERSTTDGSGFVEDACNS
jgi:Concanavalin A-like lectin/glucanases superfamily